MVITTLETALTVTVRGLFAMSGRKKMLIVRDAAEQAGSTKSIFLMTFYNGGNHERKQADAGTSFAADPAYDGVASRPSKRGIVGCVGLVGRVVVHGIDEGKHAATLTLTENCRDK